MIRFTIWDGPIEKATGTHNTRAQCNEIFDTYVGDIKAMAVFSENGVTHTWTKGEWRIDTSPVG